jgi:hypothetical protein
MKKTLKIVLCLAVPGLIFLNAWEGFRYATLEDQVAALERQQKELLDANRDAIGRIAYESSPDRVAEKAAEMGLASPDAADVTLLLVEPAGGEGR